MAHIETAPCLVCGNTQSVEYGRKGDLLLAECMRCRFVFLHPTPVEEEVEELYNVGEQPQVLVKRSWHRTLRRRAMVAWVERYLRGGRVLDIGCNTGDLLATFRNTGRWEAVGVDLNLPALLRAKERGLEVHNQTLEECAFPDRSFTAVILSQVVEHLHDPVAVLEEVRRILKPEGFLFIGTPNIAHPKARFHRERWGHIKDQHLWYFAPDTIKQFLNATGYRVVFCWWLDPRSRMRIAARPCPPDAPPPQGSL